MSVSLDLTLDSSSDTPYGDREGDVGPPMKTDAIDGWKSPLVPLAKNSASAATCYTPLPHKPTVHDRNRTVSSTFNFFSLV